MSGSGSYVSVPENVVKGVSAGWVNGTNYLSQSADQRSQIINEMRDRVTPALELLVSLLDGNLLPDGWENILRNVTIDPLRLIDRGSLQDAPTLDLPDDWNVTIPILALLKDVPELEEDDEPDPTTPERPTWEMTYTEGNYVSPVNEDLYSLVINGLRNGGSILNEEVQALLLVQGQKRQKSIRDNTWQKLQDGIGADGFDLTGGAEASILSTALSQFEEEDTALNRDITIKMAELADLNQRFIIDKAQALEQLAVEFHNSRENRKLETDKAMATFILGRYQADATVYLQQWEGKKIKLETAVQRVELVLKQNEMTLQKFLGEMDGAKAEIELKKSRNEGIVEGFKGEIEGYKAQLQERGDWWKALTDEQRNVVSQNDLELRKAIAEVEALVQGILSDSNLKANVTKDLAAIIAQILASAFTSMHTGITHSTSVNESLTESVGSHATLNSSHSFDETKTS